MCGPLTIQHADDGKVWITQDGSTIIIKKELINETCGLIMGKKTAGAFKNSFELFWHAYPKKQGKKPCMAKWCEVIKPDDELVKTIMAALEAQKATEQWQKNGGMFIPMCSTWLNQSRWEDEIDVAVTAVTNPIMNGEW